jgi:hypothetical protein
MRRLKLLNNEVVASGKEEEEFFAVISMRDVRVLGPVCCSLSSTPLKSKLKHNSWSIANRSSVSYYNILFEAGSDKYQQSFEGTSR